MIDDFSETERVGHGGYLGTNIPETEETELHHQLRLLAVVTGYDYLRCFDASLSL